MKKILLLEDDPLLSISVKELLETQGYEVTLVLDGDAASEVTYENKFDLYIFDINVPNMNGFELLEALRNVQDATPTIFISALVDLESISKGFALGADDYIKKPFDPMELLIRVNAKLAQPESKKLSYKDIEYDPAKHIATKDGEILSLGDVQLKFLELLLQNQVVDRELFYDVMENPSPSALRTAIAKLKKKLGVEIKNVRGVGYTLE